RFGNDLVTIPKAPAVGPTDNSNSNYTVQPGFFGAQPSSSVVTTSNSAQNSVDNTKSSIDSQSPSVLPPAPSPTGSTGSPTTYTWFDGSSGHLTPDVNGYGTIGYNAANDPNVQNEVTSGNQIYANQETALQQQRDQAIANLTQQENQDVAALNTTQANETGGSTRNLLAMGGYLGNNSFSNSYLVSLQVSHEQAMQTLQAKYQSAIQAAQNAYTNNDFTLAEKEVANASAIQKAAQDRNTEFLNQTDKIQTEARAAAAAEQTQLRDAQTFAKDNNLTSPYYQYPGSSQVYDTRTGLQVTADQYATAGGAGEKGNYSDIQVIQPQDKHSPAYTEWQDYLSTGGKLSFNDYENMDANRKASHVTNITYNQQQQQTQAQNVSDTV